MSDFTLEQFNRESWLAAFLGITDLDAGVTTAEQRRERIRTRILERELADTECFRKAGKTCSYADAFSETYAQPLQTDELQIVGDTGAR